MKKNNYSLKKNSSHRCLVLLLLLVLLSSVCLDVVSGQGDWPMEVVIAGGLDDPFPGRVADFGNHKPPTLFLDNVNLIIPPASASHLCKYPREAWATNEFVQEEETFVNATTNDRNRTNVTSQLLSLEEEEEEIEMEPQLVARDNMNVALFVSYGGCQPSQKARVAAALQRNYTRYGTVTHLLIYNNNRNIDSIDDLHTLTTFVDDTEFRDVGVIFVSTRSGEDIMEAIEKEESRQRIASPFLFAEGNELWYFPVSFREIQLDKYSGSGGPLAGGSTSGGFDGEGADPYAGGAFDPQQYPPAQRNVHNPEADDFYWFRLIVFSILVVSPCFRAAYLWYAGGARIRLRYNEEGRVVGLQYIPPMPYWFSPRPEEPYVPTATRMTPEQVMALPEIVYEGSPTSHHDDEDFPLIPSTPPPPEQKAAEVFVSSSEHGTTSTTNPAESFGASTEDLSVSSAKTPTAAISDIDNATSSETVSNSPTTDEEQGNSSAFVAGMQSCCSICIDDFEQGEKLRMLPRCRHIFHLECIKPWLCERQGCCPLCKVEVLEPEPGEDAAVTTAPAAAAAAVESEPPETFENEGDQVASLVGLPTVTQPSFTETASSNSNNTNTTNMNMNRSSSNNGSTTGQDVEAQRLLAAADDDDDEEEIETFINEPQTSARTTEPAPLQSNGTNVNPGTPSPAGSCDFQNEPDDESV